MAVRIDEGVETFTCCQTIPLSFVQGCIHVTSNLNGTVTDRQVLTQFRPRDIEPVE